MDASRTPRTGPVPPPSAPPAAPAAPAPAAPAPAAPAPAEPPGAAWPPAGPSGGFAAPPGPASAPPATRARRLASPVLTLAGAVAAFAYVGAVDPNEPGHYPVCPLFRVTGILCPGCGGLRSAHAFAHGDLITALGQNALAVAAYFLFAGFMAVWLAGAWRGAPTPRFALKGPYWWALGGLALVFCVVRNLPFGSALAP